MAIIGPLPTWPPDGLGLNGVAPGNGSSGNGSSGNGSATALGGAHLRETAPASEDE
jgi:hypothetical protein